MATAPINKMLTRKTTIWWLPLDQAADVTAALKVANYTEPGGKAVDISCAIVSGHTLAATDSDTSTTTGLCDEAGVANPIRSNYEASLSFFREELDLSQGDGVGKMNADSMATKAFNLFKHAGPDTNVSGWLVQRVGYRQGTAAKEGQEVSLFLVRADNMRDVIGDGTEPIQFTVPFLAQGTMALNQKLTS